ncbi:MAG: fructosamine kinase family protein, partial [Gemmatimonadota bacterium]
MHLSERLRESVEAALRDQGRDEPGIVGASPVGGGCISPAARIELAGGGLAFLKWGEAGSVAGAMFGEEARSLRALAGAGAVRVPRVLAVSDGGRRLPSDSPGAAAPRVERAGRRSVDTEPLSAGATNAPPWLLLEWLEPGRATTGTWERLGRALAALHRVRAEAWGWPADNFIGSLEQPNGETDDWAAFWRDRRLGPQLRRAYGSGGVGGGGHLDDSDRRRFDRLLERLEELLADAAGADGPSLVHGDLWSGNVHALASGEPALIDPAAYHGHREVDLAMSELFGGFPPRFYDAYEEAWPLEPGYRERRRSVYQLYYLLVHVNLFGAGYVGRTRSA